MYICVCFIWNISNIQQSTAVAICQGVYLLGVYLSGGCTCRGVPAQGGVSAKGVYLLGGVPAQGGVPARGCLLRVYLLGVPARGYLLGVCLPRGYLPGGCTCPGTPPPPCGQTHRCKNITFATSLRTVIIKSCTGWLVWLGKVACASTILGLESIALEHNRPGRWFLELLSMIGSYWSYAEGHSTFLQLKRHMPIQYHVNPVKNNKMDYHVILCC